MIQKTILLIVLSLSLSHFAIAQTQKGHIQVGGSFSFGFYGIDEFQNSTFILSSNATSAYFLTDFFAVGGNLGFNLSKNNISNDESSISTGLSTGLTAAYYLGNQKAQPYVFTGVRYNTNSNNEVAPRTYYKNRSINLTLGAGYSIFIRENLSIEIGFPLNYTLGRTNLTRYTLNANGDYIPEEDTRDYDRWSFTNNIGFRIYLK